MKDHTAAQIDSPGRRAAAYWFADGLPEITFGLVLLILGVWGIAWVELHWQNWWIRVGLIVTTLLFQALTMMHRVLCRILHFLKARITYPRTGYVSPPADFLRFVDPPDKILSLRKAYPVDQNVTWFRTHTVFLFLLGSIFVSFLEARWSLPPVMAAVAAGVYFWNRDDVRPYSWPAVLPIALGGFVAAALDLEPKSRMCVPLVIGGAWLLGIGTWTLVHYLRAHPKPDAGREGRP